MKKLLALVLSVLLVVGVLPLTADTARAAIVDSGKCGDNLTWTLDDAGTLTISGTGAMNDYNYRYDHGHCTTAPWSGSGENAQRIKNVVIQNDVTNIGENAFSYCTGMKSVTIPDSVTRIEAYAFSDCTRLTTVTIPDSVTSIGESAFLRCTGLTSMEIPNSVTSIGGAAFVGCSGLTNVTIPDSVTSIEWEAFRGCTGLTSVTIPDSVTRIGEYAFSGCEGLRSVIIPDSVMSIGSSAFSRCTGLTEVTIPNSVMSIGSSAFSRCTGLTEVTIPNSVTFIWDYAFSGCTGLISVMIPVSVTSIEKKAFYGCSYIENTYYSGTEEQWQKINIGEGNEDLTANVTYNYTFSANDQELFFGASTVYNHQLGQFCADCARLGYGMEDKDNDPLVMQLKKYGFTLEKMDPDADRDEVNYFIASKDATSSGKNYKIVFVGCIGSHKKQWYSNFDPEATERDFGADRDLASYSNSIKKHKGFDDAQRYVYVNLKNYIDDLKKDGISSDDIKIVVTGHSRGAAAANLLAARLIDEQYEASALAKEGNITAYTFATPRPVLKTETGGSQYNCIFNIVNPEDFVTKVMLNKWGYGRYGVTYTLPSKTNDENHKEYLEAMRPFYKEYTGETYSPYLAGELETATIIGLMGKNVGTAQELYSARFNAFWKKEGNLLKPDQWSPFEFFKKTLLPVVAKEKTDYDTIKNILKYGSGTFYREILIYFILPDKDHIINAIKELSAAEIEDHAGEKFDQAHNANTYCAYMQALTSEQLQEKRMFNVGAIKCPVDIEIYDNGTNELVGRIVNNVIDETIAAKDNSVVMSVEGDSKEYWLPSNGDYTVKLIGNDDGTMDYTLSVMDSDVGEMQRANVYDVPIEKDKTLTVAGTDKNDVSNVKIVDETGTSVGETKVIEEPAKATVDITVTTEGSGTATENQTVTEGDYVMLTAIPAEDTAFKGWYQGDELISEEAEYAFVAKTSVTLRAVFEDNQPDQPEPPAYALGDVNNDGAVKSDDARLALRASVKLEPDIVKGTAAYTAADCNKDGEVKSDDARAILRASVGLEQLS